MRDFLDEVVPLDGASHRDVTGYTVSAAGLAAHFTDGTAADGTAKLADPGVFAGYAGDPGAPSAILLRHHGLHIEIAIDRAGAIGSADPAGVQDVIVEAALTTIVDFEDSVAAVDAADKVAAYRNWLGLNTGELTAPVAKGGRTFTRRLEPDRGYTDPSGAAFALTGRALLLVRNVGHLMTTDAILDADGAEVYEGMLDAIVTALTALPDLRADSPWRNGTKGSVYIVKPKQHGPEEVAFTVTLFGRVEELLGLAAPHAQDRADGRGTADLGQPRRVRQGGGRQDRVHQHRLPRPLRRRDAHLVRGRPDGPQGGHEDRSRGYSPTRTATWTSVSRTGSPGGRRSARACGRCRT